MAGLTTTASQLLFLASRSRGNGWLLSTKIVGTIGKVVRALRRALGRCRVHVHVRVYDGSRRSLACERRGLVLPTGRAVGSAHTYSLERSASLRATTFSGQNLQ